jgi:hypothetical protein
MPEDALINSFRLIMPAPITSQTQLLDHDFHNTTKISAVFLAGKEFDRAALDEMLRKAEAAAKVPAVK